MDKPEKPDLTPPARVSVTTAWLEEMRRRQAAYAAQRARWLDAFRRGARPEPPTDADAPDADARGGVSPGGDSHRSGRSRTIHDPRQFRFDF
jgi:hypothetical protein